MGEDGRLRDGAAHRQLAGAHEADERDVPEWSVCNHAVELPECAHRGTKFFKAG